MEHQAQRRAVISTLSAAPVMMLGQHAFAQANPIRFGGTLPLTGGNAAIGKVAYASMQIW